MSRSCSRGRVALACLLLAASCSPAEGPRSPGGAYWTVREAIEDGRAQDAIDGFTEKGRRVLAANCLLQVLYERRRQPAVETLRELAEQTDGEPSDPWHLEMKGGVEAAARHGLDRERLDALIARLEAALDGTGSPDDLVEALRAEVDALSDLNAFLVDLVPLAWISIFENASLGEVELDGSRATIPVTYLDSALERTPGAVELVRKRGVWKVDTFG